MRDWRTWLPAQAAAGGGIERASGCSDDCWSEFMTAMGVITPTGGLALDELNSPESLQLSDRLAGELTLGLVHRCWRLDRPAPDPLTVDVLNGWITGALRHASPGKLYMSATPTSISFSQRGPGCFELPLLIGPDGVRLGPAVGSPLLGLNVAIGTPALLTVGSLGPGELLGELRSGRLVLRVSPGGSFLFAFCARAAKGSTLFPLPKTLKRFETRLARIQQQASR